VAQVVYQPIGVIHTPFAQPEGAPHQPRFSSKAKGWIEIAEELAPGLRDLDGFSHIVLIYHFHQSGGFDLAVTPSSHPFLRGLFATRSPRRPNAIGVSVVRLLSIEGGVIHIENVDMIDNTPLLDIKPYIPQVDDADDYRLGWLNEKPSQADDTDNEGEQGK